MQNIAMVGTFIVSGILQQSSQVFFVFVFVFNCPIQWKEYCIIKNVSMICWAAPLLSHCWNTTTIVKGSVSKWQACELYIIPCTTCTTEKKVSRGKNLWLLGLEGCKHCTNIDWFNHIQIYSVNSLETIGVFMTNLTNLTNLDLKLLLVSAEAL